VWNDETEATLNLDPSQTVENMTEIILKIWNFQLELKEVYHKFTLSFANHTSLKDILFL